MTCRAISIASALVLITCATPCLAGSTIEEAGTITCVTDKWEEKEKSKGHKLVDAASRCVLIPDDQTAPKVAEACAGKYEFLPDQSWKGTGTCTDTMPGGDKVYLNWEEGSHLGKAYTFTKTGGTGKYEGATGGGTYFYENVTDTLVGGRYQGKIVLP